MNKSNEHWDHGVMPLSRVFYANHNYSRPPTSPSMPPTASKTASQTSVEETGSGRVECQVECWNATLCRHVDLYYRGGGDRPSHASGGGLASKSWRSMFNELDPLQDEADKWFASGETDSYENRSLKTFPVAPLNFALYQQTGGKVHMPFNVRIAAVRHKSENSLQVGFFLQDLESVSATTGSVIPVPGSYIFLGFLSEQLATRLDLAKAVCNAMTVEVSNARCQLCGTIISDGEPGDETSTTYRQLATRQVKDQWSFRLYRECFTCADLHGLFKMPEESMIPQVPGQRAPKYSNPNVSPTGGRGEDEEPPTSYIPPPDPSSARSS